ncbi:MAG: hypothetical protein OXQ29_16870 [Rhodospirillaceae bacterium]|nr:hypothetical protein [Rhodospirillaceae bacterium]
MAQTMQRICARGGWVGDSATIATLVVLSVMVLMGFTVEGDPLLEASQRGPQVPATDAAVERLTAEVATIHGDLEFLEFAVEGLVNAGQDTVVAWYPTSESLDSTGALVPPVGWLICDGDNGTPDLRDRFIYGTGSLPNVGETGGEPTHGHDVSFAASEYNEGIDRNNSGPARWKSWERHGHTLEDPLDDGLHLPPFLRMVYIIRAPDLPPELAVARVTTTTGGADGAAALLAEVLRGNRRADALERAVDALMPARAIVAWYPRAADVNAEGDLVPPRGWLFCDGTEGAPDLRGRLVYGTANFDDVGIAGGSETHGHTGGRTTAGGSRQEGDPDDERYPADDGHRHASVNMNATSHLPPGRRMVYLLKTVRDWRLPRAAPASGDVGVVGLVEESLQDLLRRVGQLEDSIEGTIPNRAIIAWYPASGAEVGDAPTGWLLCDGENGTPDLQDQFIYGTTSAREVGEAVGEGVHGHTGVTSSHSSGVGTEEGGDLRVARGDHGHRVTAADASHLPPFVRLAWIMKM